MNSITIIGAGRLGASLGFALSQKGYEIGPITCRTSSSAEESQRIIGKGIPSTDPVRAAAQGHIVCITVADDDIESIVSDLEAACLDWKNRIVFHFSGLLTSEVLWGLKKQGAFVASVHPVQTIPGKIQDLHLFKDVFFSLEGDKEAVKTAEEMVGLLGGKTIILENRIKALFHSACSVASNHLIALLGASSSILASAGLEEEKALEITFPLIQRTLQNVKKVGLYPALSGPVIRGDEKTLRSHLIALQELPEELEVYKSLTRLILKRVEMENQLSQKKIKAIKELLEGK